MGEGSTNWIGKEGKETLAWCCQVQEGILSHIWPTPHMPPACPGEAQFSGTPGQRVGREWAPDGIGQIQVLVMPLHPASQGARQQSLEEPGMRRGVSQRGQGKCQGSETGNQKGQKGQGTHPALNLNPALRPHHATQPVPSQILKACRPLLPRPPLQVQGPSRRPGLYLQIPPSQGPHSGEELPA